MPAERPAEPAAEGPAAPPAERPVDVLPERPAGRRVREAVENLPLVDHHVHGALRGDVDRRGFELMLTEADKPAPAGTSAFDSQLGFAVRRWCAPVLDLPPHASPEPYLERRAELGTDEVNRRFLGASGTGHVLLETGYRGDLVLDLEGMRRASGRPVDEVVRLEPVVEELALSGVGAGELADRYAERLWQRSEKAVGLKTIVAYRYGLDFDPERPTPAQVAEAAGRWLGEAEASHRARVTDPVLLRHLIWAGVDRGLPVQFHAGFGDPDLELRRCDPLLLTRFLRLVAPRGVPILLLHNYPYHRGAGYLAQVFPDVYADVGLALNNTGARSAAVLAESLELAPFGKILFSSDAWGPSELHFLGALLWRRATARVLGGWVEAGEWGEADAVRVANMIGVDNARRVYRLGDG